MAHPQRPNDCGDTARRPEENANTSNPTTNINSSSTAAGSVNVKDSVIGSATFNAIQDQRQYDQSQHVHHHHQIIFPAGAYRAALGSTGQYLLLTMAGGGFGCAPEVGQATGSVVNFPEEVSHQYVAVHPPLPPLPQTNILPNSNGIEYFRDRPISAKARVYPGRQKLGPDIYRDVAIKVTSYAECNKQEEHNKWEKRKKREVKNLLQLTPHLNVVAFIHSDTYKSAGEYLYIVMEMCNPLTLENYIMKRKESKIPFNPIEAVEFSKQLIEGINHIHQNNIIHRDLKPSSVLFSVCGRSIKIIDFGMSKPLKYGLSQLSLSTLLIGTDGYRAPETYNKDKIKKESDIFSLAILLYHVWSYGYHPFDPKSLWSHNIKEGNAPDFSRLLVPDAECAKGLLQSMLVNDPNKRASITDARNHAFNTRAINDTLTKSTVALWTGSIEASSVKMNMKDCVLYKEKQVAGAGIDSRCKLNLNIVPGGVAVDTLQVPVEQTPHGYLGIKLACSKCMKEKLKEEQSIVWIDIYDHQGKKTRALLIIRPPDYDELYAVLVRNPERLISALQSNLGDKQETVTDEPAVDADEGQQSTDELHGGEEADPIEADMIKANVEESKPTGQVEVSDDGAMSEDMPEDITPHEAEPRLDIPIGHLVLIPWWMHDPPSQ